MLTKSYAIYDIESHLINEWGAYHTQYIFCIAVKRVIAGVEEPTKIYTPNAILDADGDFKQALEAINSCDYRVGHNITRYDDIAMEELGAVFTNKPFDTLLYTQVMYTKDQLMSMDYGIENFPKDLYGNFSLKAFGYRLGQEQKLEFEQFDKLTTDMLVYCKRDVDVTYNLFKHIINSDRLPNDYLMQLEHDTSTIISMLERDGFYMDKDKARKLSLKMTLEMQAIQNMLAKVFKPMYLPEGKPQKTNNTIKRKLYIPNTAYKDLWYLNSYFHFKPYGKPLRKYKSGKIRHFGKRAFKWFTTPHTTVITTKDGEFQNIKLTKFKATDNQIIWWFKNLYNYTFTTYTTKGNIRVDRDVLKTFDEYLKTNRNSITRFANYTDEEFSTELEAISKLMRFLKLKKDLSQLSGTDKSLLSVQRLDGTITTRINQNGTVTGRVTSSSVNMNQIPSSQEFRELFTAPIMYTIPDKLYYELMETLC